MSRQLRSNFVVAILVALVAGIVSITASDTEKERVFQGVWVDGFEIAAFFEGASARDIPTLQMPSDGWLTFDEGQWPSEARSPNLPNWNETAFFEISFVGQKKVGRAGHMDQYPAEFTVERLISIDRVEPEDTRP